MVIYNFLRKISANDVLFARYDNYKVELENIHGNQNQIASASNSSSIEEQDFHAIISGSNGKSTRGGHWIGFG